MLKLRKRSANVKIIVKDLDGNILEEKEIPNLIVTVALNMERDGWAGDVTDTEIKYIGWGDDPTPPILVDTILGNELGRKALTSSSKPAAGQWKSVWYIAPDEAVGLIEELGWFAGAAAAPWPGGKDSGILVARVLYNRTKTALESIQVERTDSIEEA